MANTVNPFGFMAVGVGMGGAHPRMLPYNKIAGYATAIFPGDLVNQVADGSIEASATPGTTAFTGVANTFGAASTATDHMVYVDPFQLFEAQDDGSGSGFLQVDRGLNANAVFSAGVLLSKKSGHQIATSTKAVTATLDLHLFDKLNVPGNDYGVNCRVLCTINKHRFGQGIAGV